MSGLATQRLVDASAALEPADRALLSLLINHGLDDKSLARMMQATPAAIASRRQQLVQRLGATLGLPPESVLAALEELAASNREQTQADELQADELHADELQADVHSPAAAETSAAEAAPSNGGPPALVAGRPAATPPPKPSLSRARRRVLVGLALLIAAIVLVVILSSGKAKRAPKAATSAHSTATATATATATPPAPTTPTGASSVTTAGSAAPGSAARRATLASLPGGPAGVSGSATILGPAGGRRLAMTASGLPKPGHKHYELWLYNSVLDSFSLGLVRAPSDSITAALPTSYHHYRWLDISLQPRGSVNHSGQSILRTPLPH